MSSKLYATDFYAWTLEQSKLFQEGKWQTLDINNLVEEIESLGKQQRQELRNRLGILKVENDQKKYLFKFNR